MLGEWSGRRGEGLGSGVIGEGNAWGVECEES